ncbi:hypothetical protein IKE07_01860 [Candidatus Saccharibacteria bacterium]|nr:hypothetical protein [Candidatus Saccharibacteria bacterium]
MLNEPNKETYKAIEDAENDKNMAGPFSSTEELTKSLESKKKNPLGGLVVMILVNISFGIYAFSQRNNLQHADAAALVVVLPIIISVIAAVTVCIDQVKKYIKNRDSSLVSSLLLSILNLGLSIVAIMMCL